MPMVDVSVLKEWVENWFYMNRNYHPYSKSNDIPIPELYDILERMPTVDVVRCADCVYYKDAEFNIFSAHDRWCTYALHNSYYREPDEYCSKGERREDGNNK